MHDGNNCTIGIVEDAVTDKKATRGRDQYEIVFLLDRLKTSVSVRKVVERKLIDAVAAEVATVFLVHAPEFAKPSGGPHEESGIDDRLVVQVVEHDAQIFRPHVVVLHERFIKRRSHGFDDAAKTWAMFCKSVRSANPSLPVRTNAQLVQDVATRADAWGTRQGLSATGHVSGTLKHGYADKLLTRYQRMFGNRGLRTEQRYLNGQVWQEGMGLKGTVRLDVVEGPLTSPTAVYDYKFGGASLSSGRISRIRTGAGLGPNVPVLEINP